MPAYVSTGVTWRGGELTTYAGDWKVVERGDNVDLVITEEPDFPRNRLPG